MEGERYRDEIFTDVTTEHDIHYGTALDENGIDEALLLDLNQPSGDDVSERPAVVWIHGGSFQHGHKAEMSDLARGSARRGFVSISVNYRLREDADFDYTDSDDPVGIQAKLDGQHDVQAAVRWLRANAGELRIDPEQIFLAGFSAGGTVALQAAANPDDPGRSGNAGPSSSVAGVVAISASLDPGILQKVSVPTLLIHGTDDGKVPLAGVEAACSADAECELAVVEGAVHNMINTNRDEIVSESSRFLHDEVTP